LYEGGERYTMLIYTAGRAEGYTLHDRSFEERDTPCTSTLLMAKMDTPGMATLIMVWTDTHTPQVFYLVYFIDM
jgi:hypothetical protein